MHKGPNNTMIYTLDGVKYPHSTPLGAGGSKMVISCDDYALFLPNKGSFEDIWVRMVEEEKQISDEISKLGLKHSNFK